ncbi:hypothetical protein [Streptomyces sp. NPDC026673]|uniref:hypothetical protein n=1 Tax=Streptomyces sp. NPDC026673 TaxID=3155724 RepID=UPI0034026863
MKARRGAPSTGLRILGVAIIGLLVSGCSGDDGQAAGAPSAERSAPGRSAQASHTSSHRAESVPGASVTEAPGLPDGRVLAQAADVRGHRTLNLPGGAEKAPLSIAVNCEGRGTLKVTVEPIALSFPLECVDGEVSGTFNQIDLKRARPEGTVYVEAPSSVRWSMTIGE